MLVIDGVELAMINEIFEIRDLNHRHAVAGQEHPQPLYKAVQVRHVGQDIVGVNDVRPHSLVLEILGQGGVKKFAQRLDAPFFPGDSGHVLRRLDTQNRDTPLLVYWRK